MSREFSIEELKKYSGKDGGKIYVALNFNVFDVTVKGKSNYGPGGQYESFAGRDISRAMATMAMVHTETYDELTDLNEDQKKSLITWEKNFKVVMLKIFILFTTEKYEIVGKLVK
ncbi:hypothetical protein HELRODRAFT_177786 [Helobdella robusta]|uniref:Cytochrome b5 heme-binding domain-containing protein n=1 Tax=Helobdella robusta TaxID=6412 RepID=T1FC96_HELRO|nr:hypothetical protein HELRODRAFT_177786 [Helobdella robusta]ESN97726.1 hypothetical protein HELRODRAFT_177786 [Helobdella robusta]